MKLNRLFSLLAVLSVIFLTSCKSGKKGNSDWLKEYDVKVAVDETFKPILENIIQSYGMAYPEAQMKPQYVSEDQAIRLLVNDSVRCIVVTRKLKDNELTLIKGHTLSATQALIASDAIALVVNKQNTDSLITLDEIKGIVTGKITR